MPRLIQLCGSEIDSFRDNPDIDALEPLFVRYQNKMEAALEDFAADEGLTSETEIIDALRACRDDGDAAKNEWKKLDKMIDTMTKKEEFFIMMMKKAERMHNRTQEPPHPERLKGGGAGGKSNDNGGGSKSSKKWKHESTTMQIRIHSCATVSGFYPVVEKNCFKFWYLSGK